MNRTLRWLLACGLLLFGCMAIAAVIVFLLAGPDPVESVQVALLRLQLAGRESELSQPVSSDTTPARFTVASGDTPRVVAGNLAAAGLIADPDLFVMYVRAEGLDRQIEAGTYFLTQAQPMTEIARALTDSSSSQIPFRILEGWRIEEVAAAIDQQPLFGFTGNDFLQAVDSGAAVDPEFAAAVGLPANASLEGFLFPETYALPATVTPDSLRDILLDEFMTQAGTPLAGTASAQGWTLFEAVTLASIIQREAVHPDEMPRISSVYRNRLDAGMRLEADPTVQYGIGFRDGRWWPQITQADYTNAVSPWNTYLNAGLPPGPIVSPGLSAILAALQPETTPYFYFRAACDGSGYHNFAVSFAEHVANECP